MFSCINFTPSSTTTSSLGSRGGSSSSNSYKPPPKGPLGSYSYNYLILIETKRNSINKLIQFSKLLI